MKTGLQRDAFRAALDGDRCCTLAAVCDPVSARLAESVGYEAGILPGSLASLAVLGAPDLTLITLTELAEQTRRTCRASRLPVLVDADHGYGNALNVQRCVAELEAAAAAALTIEDTSLPEAFGGAGSLPLASVAETVGKLRAAVGARVDPKLAIVGRTHAAAARSVEEFVERVRAFEQAGVDALFLAGVTQRTELERVAAATTLPLILGLVPQGLADSAFLSAHRVKLRHIGIQPIEAGFRATEAAMQQLLRGEPPESRSSETETLIAAITRSSDYAKARQDFLT